MSIYCFSLNRWHQRLLFFFFLNVFTLAVYHGLWLRVFYICLLHSAYERSKEPRHFCSFSVFIKILLPNVWQKCDALRPKYRVKTNVFSIKTKHRFNRVGPKHTFFRVKVRYTRFDFYSNAFIFSAQSQSIMTWIITQLASDIWMVIWRFQTSGLNCTAKKKNSQVDIKLNIIHFETSLRYLPPQLNLLISTYQLWCPWFECMNEWASGWIDRLFQEKK